MKTYPFAVLLTLALALANTVFAADKYDVEAECSVNNYAVQGKCGLSMHLNQDYADKTVLKKIIFKVNGNTVHITYNDTTPLATNTLTALSSFNPLPVTCGKSYNVSAYVVTAQSNAETKVGNPQIVACPAKVNF
jgi:hypothetical protein